jgi:hypothetical protein
MSYRWSIFFVEHFWRIIINVFHFNFFLLLLIFFLSFAVLDLFRISSPLNVQSTYHVTWKGVYTHRNYICIFVCGHLFQTVIVLEQISFHEHFNAPFYARHPNIFIFLDMLHQIQTSTYITIRSLDTPAL